MMSTSMEERNGPAPWPDHKPSKKQNFTGSLLGRHCCAAARDMFTTPMTIFFTTNLLALLSVVLVSISYPWKHVIIYAAISLSDVIKVSILAPLVWVAFTLWISPLPLLFDRAGQRQCGKHETALFWTMNATVALLFGFTQAYVWANSARHARNDKLVENGSQERNSELMEDTLYALDELAGHWLPLGCTLFLFVLVAMRERKRTYFQLSTWRETRAYTALFCLFCAIHSGFFINYCLQGNSFVVFYPMAGLVALILVTMRWRDGILTTPSQCPANTLLIGELCCSLMAVSIFQIVKGYPYLYGLPGYTH